MTSKVPGDCAEEFVGFLFFSPSPFFGGPSSEFKGEKGKCYSRFCTLGKGERREERWKFLRPSATALTAAKNNGSGFLPPPPLLLSPCLRSPSTRSLKFRQDFSLTTVFFLEMRLSLSGKIRQLKNGPHGLRSCRRGSVSRKWKSKRTSISLSLKWKDGISLFSKTLADLVQYVAAFLLRYGASFSFCKGPHKKKLLSYVPSFSFLFYNPLFFLSD